MKVQELLLLYAATTACDPAIRSEQCQAANYETLVLEAWIKVLIACLSSEAVVV